MSYDKDENYYFLITTDWSINIDSCVVEDSNTNLDEGLVSFFSGVLMGAGLLTLLNVLLTRKKRVTTDTDKEISK